MRYITFAGDESRIYRHDYNTENFAEEGLEELCRIWTDEDNDGTEYYLSEE